MAAITFTAADVKRLLNLPSTGAVELLIQQKVLDIHGYTRLGRPLFTAEAIHTAAAHIFKTSDPLEQLRRKYASIPRAAEAKSAADLVQIICTDQKYREGGDFRSVLSAVLDTDPLLKELYAG
ncbi:MAG: hypothetical protein DMD96_03835 [Candidatus Rokuibacteriota bacterium]|nr:MAG: hypothetical protein DMD96_03835 [Candidatus Rokubacteria bacterium]